MLKNTALAGAALALFLVAAPANAAIVYNLNLSVGDGTAVGSITTDGTFGTLVDANVIDWNISLNDGLTGFTLLGPLSGNNSEFDTTGGLVASAANLTFDFSSAAYALFQNPFTGSSINYLCFAGQLCGSSPNSIGLATTTHASDFTPQRGVQVVATTGAVVAVPEPVTVSLFGAGLLGAAMLRRRRAAKAA